MNDKVVWDSMYKHYKFAVKNNHDVVAVFLQGSQNYNLDTELSDVDTKAIKLPSLKEIVRNSKRTSTTLILPNNEHCDVKDITLMYDCFKKSNINFLEILFTDKFLVDYIYDKEICDLRKEAEAIAMYDYKRLVNSMIGMSYEKRKGLTHPYPATIDKIEKYGYDGKQLHHIIRLHEFLTRMEDGESFKDCLKSNKREELNELKIDPKYSVEEAVALADKTIEEMKTIRESSKKYAESEKNEDVEEFLNESLYKIITKSIKRELKD